MCASTEILMLVARTVGPFIFVLPQPGTSAQCSARAFRSSFNHLLWTTVGLLKRSHGRMLAAIAMRRATPSSSVRMMKHRPGRDMGAAREIRGKAVCPAAAINLASRRHRFELCRHLRPLRRGSRNQCGGARAGYENQAPASAATGGIAVTPVVIISTHSAARLSLQQSDGLRQHRRATLPSAILPRRPTATSQAALV
jgi:hypothetical protein